MTKAKRYHPILMIFNLWKLVKNSIFFVVYLFIIQANSDSMINTYGRIIFVVLFGITLISIILKWYTQKYEIDERSFHLYNGIFNKTERTIPFSKIQNVNKHTSLFHRIFKVTSIRFETGMSGEDDAVKFEVISQIESERIETHINHSGSGQFEAVQEKVDDPELTSSETIIKNENRTIHFKPTKRDIFKASFTSLSFVVLIPIMGSFYFKIDEIFKVEEDARGIFEKLMNSSLLLTILIIVLVIVSAGFGIVRTFLKYGKYEISSDHDRIYIIKGVIDETAFSISKEKVQAIEIKQSPMKRLLGLAEVKMTSAGSVSLEEDKLEINSLYPFLPVKRAYEMVSEILPSYEVTQTMDRLPNKSFWIRMLSPSWLWIAATIALFYFKPNTFLNWEDAWWILSIVLLIIICALRLLDFFHTQYVLNEHFIQLKKGSLTTSLFISKRNKVIEVKVKRNIFQKLFGLASIETTNRAKPLHHAGIDDVPLEQAESFLKWYIGRRNEIKVQ